MSLSFDPISALRLLVCCQALLLVDGCLSSPSPLAPGLQGSVGMPSRGILTASVELPSVGPGFVRYRPHGSAYWGTPALVQLVQEAAAAVEEEAPNGAPLVVGDLSARYGGPIPRHASHRTGRDVDLLWYVTTAHGAPVRNPGFIAVGADGLAFVPDTPIYLSLDVRRQWLLFRALLTSETGLVQWLFVSEAVEALIVDYARARGEPLDLIWHAETIMQQPRGAAPHDDHVHVRLACTQDQAASGCVDAGPHWDWLPALPVLPTLDGAALLQIATDDPLLTPAGDTAKLPLAEPADYLGAAL